MNTNKKFDDIMKEIIREKNKYIMSEYEKMAEEAENTHSSAIDENLIKAMIEYEKKDKERRKKKYFSILSKVAILLITCVVSANFIFPESVDAFKTKIFGKLFNEVNESLSLKNENEINIIDNWNDYYYPQYIPKDYEIVAAEKTDEGSIMLFLSHNKEHELRIEEILGESGINIDTTFTQILNISIRASEGQYAINEQDNYVLLAWPEDNRIIVIRGDMSLSQQEYIKIAENMKYLNK